MRKKILFVIHAMGHYGAEKIMAFLANELSVEAYDIYLLTYENNDLHQKISPRVHHVENVPPKLSVVGLRRFQQILYVRKVIRDIHPDAILSFLDYPNIISILASRGTGIPMIISQRDDPFAERGWFTTFKDFIFNFADGYVFQTNGAKGYFNKRIQEKGIVIPNPSIGNIPPRWDGPREDIIVNVASFLVRQKRQDLLIQAFSKIAGKYPHIRLVLYGGGEGENEIKRMISDCQLEDRVILSGVTKNVFEAIKKAKLFVLSSDWEGTPNALIEAMSVGLPCISTDCSPGGAAELIKNMENGLLVNAGDIDGLANAMDFMLSHSKAAESMGVNAQEVTRELDPNAIIGKWKSYINQQMLAKHVNP